MRIVPLVCAVFAAMVSVAQAESTIMKQSESMRLTEQQMNTITAGARGVMVISHALGTTSSYSRSTSFSIPNFAGISFKGHGKAVACCGAETSTHVVINSYITKLSHYILADIYHSITDGHHRHFYNIH